MTMLLSASLSPLAESAGPSAREPAVLRHFAARVDRAGLDFLVLHGPADAMIAASWLITFTRRIGLVCGNPATYAQPFHTARALAAMDCLSSGRMGWLPTLAGHDELSPAYGPGVSLPRDAAAAKGAEYIAATQALWDSWDADALIIDKESAVYLNSAKIRRVDFQGEYFRVMGPLNAARPPQGYPVLVRDDADREWQQARHVADLVLVGVAAASEAQSRIATLRTQGATRILLKVCCTSNAVGGPALAAVGPALAAVGHAEHIAEQLTTWQRTLGCDGFHILAHENLHQCATLLESLLRELSARGVAPSDREGVRSNSGTLRERLGLPVPINRYSSP